MKDSNGIIHSLGDPSIEIEVIKKVLEQAPHPLTAKQLQNKLTGPFKLDEKRLAHLLEDQVAAGRFHRFAALHPSKQPRYWTRNLEEYARESILAFLSQRPHTQAQLLRRLKSRLGGFGPQQQINLLTHLVREKEVRPLPPFIGSRTMRYSTTPPDPGDYLVDAVKKISHRLGLPAEVTLRAMRTLTFANSKNGAMLQDELSEKLLTRMVQIKLAAARGGLVPLNELWQSLQHEGWDKAGFDRTVLNLAEKYRVSLQRHNFPASLNEQERAELVADRLGNYYVGIALR
ncbi:MAG TPA: hypothetical protein VJ302_26160 [Blastocatellia bacterium]|nr:hypothetical protein [Blastocatellia bacterium]